MFRANQPHPQPALISSVNELPERRRQRLENSWAGTFRSELYQRVREEAFAVMYSDVPSRPNVPVNVLVSLDVLKAGYGWSDEELYDHFLYDLQVRYALGYESLTDGEFELRTLYNFRRRLTEYNTKHGTNLLEVAFADITDQQVTILQVRTGQQRMDSTEIASNIAIMSRLQLTVEAIQRLQRLMSEAERAKHAELLAPYSGETAGHLVHRVKGKAATDTQLQLAGQTLYQLLQVLAADYGQEPVYQVALRLLTDQYRVVADAAQPKANHEISARSLQSLDDLEATYRRKHGVSYKGYVANVAETCDPENALQLITDVCVAPNAIEDSALLVAALPDLKQRTDVDTLHADGAFGGEASDCALREEQVTLIQSSIVGPKPDPQKLYLADFAITQDERGIPLSVTCPQGQTVPIGPGLTSRRFAAHFDGAICATCPFHAERQCPARPAKRRPSRRLSFTQAQAERAERHRHSRQMQEGDYHPRPGVEATVRSLKHPFPAGKLPVRGLFRMTCLIVASAAMINVRRIQRYRARIRLNAPARPPANRQPSRTCRSPVVASLPSAT